MEISSSIGREVFSNFPFFFFFSVLLTFSLIPLVFPYSLLQQGGINIVSGIDSLMPDGPKNTQMYGRKD
jgi:formate hydrogenlyase subunit 4